MIESATRTEQQLAQEAFDVQNAVNSSGVTHSLSRVFTDLWAIARERGEGTDWVNTHPVVILFLDKLSHLAGIQAIGDVIASQEIHKAYRYCRILVEEEAS